MMTIASLCVIGYQTGNPFCLALITHYQNGAIQLSSIILIELPSRQRQPVARNFMIWKFLFFSLSSSQIRERAQPFGRIGYKWRRDLLSTCSAISHTIRSTSPRRIHNENLPCVRSNLRFVCKYWFT